MERKVVAYIEHRLRPGVLAAFVHADDPESSPARASSSFETVSLDLDVWLEPLDYANRCPGIFSRR